MYSHPGWLPLSMCCRLYWKWHKLSKYVQGPYPGGGGGGGSEKTFAPSPAWRSTHVLHWFLKENERKRRKWWKWEWSEWKSQCHFVSTAAAILKEVSLGQDLSQSSCCCTVVCQTFGCTAKSQWRTQHSSKIANDPPPSSPRKNSTCVLFFAFSHRACFLKKWIESERVWQAFFAKLELKSRKWSWTRTASPADRLGGVRVIDRDRQRLGVNVVHRHSV